MAINQIETGYKPEFALGAWYAGENARNAEDANMEALDKIRQENAQSRVINPMEAFIKKYESDLAQAKSNDPNYIPGKMRGDLGLANSQDAAGKLAMGTLASEMAAQNSENRRDQYGTDAEQRLSKFKEEQLALARESGVFPTTGFPMSPQQQPQGRINLPVSNGYVPATPLENPQPESWGGEGNKAGGFSFNTNTGKQGELIPVNPIANMRKERDAVQSIGNGDQYEGVGATAQDLDAINAQIKQIEQSKPYAKKADNLAELNRVKSSIIAELSSSSTAPLTTDRLARNGNNSPIVGNNSPIRNEGVAAGTPEYEMLMNQLVDTPELRGKLIIGDQRADSQEYMKKLTTEAMAQIAASKAAAAPKGPKSAEEAYMALLGNAVRDGDISQEIYDAKVAEAVQAKNSAKGQGQASIMVTKGADGRVGTENKATTPPVTAPKRVASGEFSPKSAKDLNDAPVGTKFNGKTKQKDGRWS